MDAIEHSWRPSIRQGVLAVRSLDRRSSIRARHWYACTRQWRRIRGVQGSTPEQTSFKRSLALRETTRIQTMFWAVALAGIWFLLVSGTTSGGWRARRESSDER